MSVLFNINSIIHVTTNHYVMHTKCNNESNVRELYNETAQCLRRQSSQRDVIQYRKKL